MSLISFLVFDSSDKLDMLWNSKGTAMIAFTLTNVGTRDTKSFIQLLSFNGDNVRINFDKEGNLVDIKWSPTGCHFAICYGYVPSIIKVYDFQGNPVWNLGELHRNQILFNTQGNLFLTCDFGSFSSGTIQIYDFAERKEITNIHVKNSTDIDFSKDGHHLVTATTSKFSRIHNCYRIWTYTGELLYKFVPNSNFDLRCFQWQNWRQKKKSENRLARKIRNENKIATCSTVLSPSTESNLFGGTATTPSTATGLFGTVAKAADTLLFESTASKLGKQQQPFGANLSTISSTKTPSESGKFGANQSTIEPKDDQTSSEHKIIFFLPPKRIVSTDGDTLSLFFTNKFVFSNHFPSDFTFMGITYSCCEQFYMRFKCNYFNDTLRAANIMIIKDPKQMKQEGKKVDGFVADQWNKIKLKVMKLAVFCKFTQNSKLLLELFKTIDSTLVETSGDLYWGVGLSIDDANVANKNCWRGHNHLGYILTDLRKFLQFKPVYVKLVKEAYEFLKMKVPDYCYAKQIPQSFSPLEINMIEEWLDDNILNSNDGRGLGKCNNGITEPIINPYHHPSDRSGFGLHGKEPSKIQYEQFKKQRSRSRVFTTPSAHLVLRGNPAHLDSGDRRIGCSRGRTFYNSRILHGGSSHEERDQTQVPHDYGTQKPSGGRNTEAETKQNLEHADEPDEIQRIKKELEDFKLDFQNSQDTIRNLQQQVNELHDAQRVAQEKELLLHDHTEKNNTLEHKLENVTSELEQARIESGNTKFLISQFENMSRASITLFCLSYCQISYYTI